MVEYMMEDKRQRRKEQLVLCEVCFLLNREYLGLLGTRDHVNIHKFLLSV